MKKFLKCFLMISLAIVMLFSFACNTSGTSLENNTTGETENNSSNNTTTSYTFSSGYNYTTETNLASSVTSSSKVGVTVNSAERNIPASTISEAYNNVKGSAVGIYVSYNTTSGTATSAGSGTIVDISVDGETSSNVFYILTCYHVVSVEGASVSVYIPQYVDENNIINYGEAGYDSSKYGFTGIIGGVNQQGKIDTTQAVSLVGGDMDSDVAVLRLNVSDSTIASKITKAKIMDTQYDVKVTDEVFLLGNPTGSYPGWFTQGYIAKVYAVSSIEDIGTMTLYGLNIDAWHGSSGGGIYNLYGELVGVLNSGSDENSGMNFAIPFKIDIAGEEDKGFVNIMKQLIGSKTDTNYGYVSGRKTKFGFTVSSDATTSSPYIVSVTSGSLANSAGLMTGDVITGIKINDGEKSSNISYADFTDKMSTTKVGDKIVISLNRTSYDRGGIAIPMVSQDITLTVYQFLFCNTGN